MRLILARHGNTFNSSAEAVWVGRGEDLPLVASGIAQAEAVAVALGDTALTRIITAPLQRTRQFGEIIAQRHNPPPPLQTDARLSELDYGHWAGRSNAEIIARYGAEELEAWQKHGIWPKSGQFSPPEDEVIAGVQALAEETRCQGGTTLLVSSNGILRYLLTLIPGQLQVLKADENLKVRTGHLCALEYQNDHWRLRAWNIAPKDWML